MPILGCFSGLTRSRISLKIPPFSHKPATKTFSTWSNHRNIFKTFIEIDFIHEYNSQLFISTRSSRFMIPTAQLVLFRKLPKYSRILPKNDNFLDGFISRGGMMSSGKMPEGGNAVGKLLSGKVSLWENVGLRVLFINITQIRK